MTLLPYALGIPAFVGPVLLICWMAGEMGKQPVWWYLFLCIALVVYSAVYWTVVWVVWTALKGVYLKMTGQDRHHDDHPAPPRPPDDAPAAPPPVVDHKNRPPPADSGAWRRHIALQPQVAPAGGGRRPGRR